MIAAATEKQVTTQVYRVYIKATAQAIWDAITSRAGPRSTATAARSNTTFDPGARFGRSQARP